MKMMTAKEIRAHYESRSDEEKMELQIEVVIETIMKACNAGRSEVSLKFPLYKENIKKLRALGYHVKERIELHEKFLETRIGWWE